MFRLHKRPHVRQQRGREAPRAVEAPRPAVFPVGEGGARPAEAHGGVDGKQPSLGGPAAF